MNQVTFIRTPVAEVKSNSDYIEHMFAAADWHEKSEKLQERRWRKLQRNVSSRTRTYRLRPSRLSSY